MSTPNQQQQQQPAGAQSRQPVSYPSPTSYPSPGLSNAQYSYPAPNQQGGEPYRASPTGSNGSLSLPSMRSLDPLQQQAHQHMGSPLPPVAPMAGGPYYQGQGGMPSHQYPNVTSDPSMRYALPVTDGRIMSGGRHKKEIKRRTKTGCLTCRKRRIKCDEGHPACRNCMKSKRECLGYDPIFKQQPGPAPIQPAPSTAPSQPSTAATANPYGNQPMLQGYSAVANMSYDPALSASSPASSNQQFDYASAIDPALEAAAPAPTSSQYQQTSGMPIFRDDLKLQLQSVSPYSSGGDDILHLRGGALYSPSSPSAYSTSAKASSTTVNELLDAGGAAPLQETTEAPSTEVRDEITHIYHSLYGPGLENFVESKWFTTKGAKLLMDDKSMLAQFQTLLTQFSKTSSSDSQEMAYTCSVEARIVWALAQLCRSSSTDPTNGSQNGGIPAPDDANEAGKRLTVFEHLVCNTTATENSLTRPGTSGDQTRLREFEFWWQLGNFVCVPDGGKSDEVMHNLRGLLDGRENRDVLYSICVVRAYGRIGEYAPHEMPLHLNEADERSKLAVAKKFIRDEGIGGTGTTNVIRRLCELATRAWEITGR